MRCDMKNCDACEDKSVCNVSFAKALITKAGEEYGKFTNGQARENFKLDFEI